MPLVLALGVALGNAVNAIEGLNTNFHTETHSLTHSKQTFHLAGFGILTLASVGPIISVLMVGLFVTKCEWLLNPAV